MEQFGELVKSKFPNLQLKVTMTEEEYKASDDTAGKLRISYVPAEDGGQLYVSGLDAQGVLRFVREFEAHLDPPEAAGGEGQGPAAGQAPPAAGAAPAAGQADGQAPPAAAQAPPAGQAAGPGAVARRGVLVRQVDRPREEPLAAGVAIDYEALGGTQVRIGAWVGNIPAEYWATHRMMHAFEAQEAAELACQAGQWVRQEAPDNAGWTHVSVWEQEQQRMGFVPSGFLQPVDQALPP